MKRVTGIGGIFFKAKDAPSLQAWYKRHLGIDVQDWGGAAFTWTDAEGKPVAGTTARLIDPQESDHFAPSSAPFMVNYRVEDLHALVKVLKEEGCDVLETIDDSEYGKFAWVITQANFPYSDSSIFSSTLQPSSFNTLTKAWRSSTR